MENEMGWQRNLFFSMSLLLGLGVKDPTRGKEEYNQVSEPNKPPGSKASKPSSQAAGQPTSQPSRQAASQQPDTQSAFKPN